MAAFHVSIKTDNSCNFKEEITLKLRNYSLLIYTKALRVRTSGTYSNCTTILAHSFNSCVYRTYW